MSTSYPGRAGLPFSELALRMAGIPRFEGELPDIFRSVGGTLRNQYALALSPPVGSRDEKYHKVKVEIVGRDGRPLKVTDKKGRVRKVLPHARQGYIAHRLKAVSHAAWRWVVSAPNCGGGGL